MSDKDSLLWMFLTYLMVQMALEIQRQKQWRKNQRDAEEDALVLKEAILEKMKWMDAKLAKLETTKFSPSRN